MSQFHQAAIDYHSLGFHPIACLPRDKRTWVVWKKYQTVQPTPKEMAGWWGTRPDANVALVFGRGTFAVDLDGEGSEDLLTKAGIDLPEDAPRSRTAGGYHVLLSSDEPVPDCVGLLGGPSKPQVDIRGVGYIVAPPSVHPSGAVYEWVVPLRQELPKAPSKLIELIKSRQKPIKTVSTDNWIADALTQGVAEGLRDETCTRLAGYFLGKGLDPEVTKLILCQTFAINSTPPFPAREVYKCVDSIAKREKQGVEVRAVSMSRAMVAFQKSLDRPPEKRVPTHLQRLNWKLDGGFGRGELVYLAARAGVGKTALALQFALAAGAAGFKTLISSHEMLIEALSRRMVSQHSGVHASALKRRDLSQFEIQRIIRTAGELSPLPIWMTDTAQTFDHIYSLCERMRGNGGLDFVIVDYLQRVHSPKQLKDRRLQVEHVSSSLKSLAQEFRIPVLCLSAVSRPAKGQSTKPTMESLRESGNLEHDADVIMLLDRSVKESETTLLVAKARDGDTGPVKLEFEAQNVRFVETDAA